MENGRVKVEERFGSSEVGEKFVIEGWNIQVMLTWNCRDSLTRVRSLEANVFIRWQNVTLFTVPAGARCFR